jgi:hypothetical protein
MHFASIQSDYDSLLKKTPTEEMVAPMNLKSKFLIPVAEAFVANLERTETFAIMPSLIAFQVRRDQLWVADVAGWRSCGSSAGVAVDVQQSWIVP